MSDLTQIISDEVRNHGIISFARFMELALYCPVCGYYEKEADRVGKRGDFFTSVSVGGLFGELLACELTQWIGELGGGAHPMILEAGAHDGRLAEDVLSWMKRERPAQFSNTTYGILEPSSRRRAWQQRRLQPFGDNVRWFSNWDELRKTSAPNSGISGVIFSNELLDAFPVQRWGWDASARTWFEWGVALQDGRFAWRRMPATAAVPGPVRDIPDELLNVLPDGFVVETSPAAAQWWSEAAGMLHQGRMITIDYGGTAEEMFQPERARGTLRAYRGHQVTDDVLANPGEQDITAHVNFTAIQAAGEAAGLKTEAFVAQAKFLTSIAEHAWSGRRHFGEWTPARLRQFQTLIHPEHLGRSFRVLVQSR